MTPTTAARLRIVVDSSTCLDGCEADAAGITVVPMQLVVDGRTYRDAVDISRADFYRSLRTQRVRHTTSSPSVGDYLEAFRAAEGDVLCLTVAATLSSMFQNAEIAADMDRADRRERRIRLLDTGTAAAGLALLALEAGRLASEGRALDEVADRIGRIGRRVQMFGVLESVTYLARSGRVPQVVAAAATLLGARPVIRFSQGEGSLVGVVKGPGAARRSLERLLGQAGRAQGMGGLGEGLTATVFHADAEGEATALLERLRSRWPRASLSLSEFTPAMGVHTGPGLVGHALYVSPEAGAE